MLKSYVFFRGGGAVTTYYALCCMYVPTFIFEGKKNNINHFGHISQCLCPIFHFDSGNNVFKI